MTGKIIFNGTSSQDFGLVVEKVPSSVHASRRGNIISIPGRNGVIMREDGSFDTYTQVYDVWFAESEEYGSRSAYDMARDIAVWLLSASGFCRLEDDFEPEYYRLARYSGALDVDMHLLQCGKAKLTFDIQPQRYLKSGETPITFTGSATTIITNPTQFEARPLLKFTDTSEKLQSQTIELTMRNKELVDWNGEVMEIEGYISQMYRASVAVDVEGYEKAIISGNGYTFLDGSYKPVGKNYIETDENQRFTNLVRIVPSSAKYIVVSDYGGEYAALQLIAFRPNPGNSAAVINGTTINLDFSKHDTIYLDCDLHDAYYIDGSNANSAVTFESNVDDYPTFPGLSSGENYITSGDEKNLDFELIPRWWTL